MLNVYLIAVHACEYLLDRENNVVSCDTKIFYKTGRLRVVISTANIIDIDWRDIENVSICNCFYFQSHCVLVDRLVTGPAFAAFSNSAWFEGSRWLLVYYATRLTKDERETRIRCTQIRSKLCGYQLQHWCRLSSPPHKEHAHSLMCLLLISVTITHPALWHTDQGYRRSSYSVGLV